jgi:pimeloyl-ACP methyl ester carboxylesterase
MFTRRKFVVRGAAMAAGLWLASRASFGATNVDTAVQPGASPGKAPSLAERTFSSTRHTTRYWEAGPADGPLMIFLHGWPQIGLMWRAQIEAFAAEGWRCIAPDMRGYGGSSAPTATKAYAFKEIVDDMVELHDHLGGRPAIWVGHDLGSPVAGALAAKHAERCRGLVLVSVPYFPETFALPTLLPLVDRQRYPADTFPDGQFDYFRFYLTHFDQTVSDFDADIAASLSVIYRPGDPASASKVYRSALITQNGGWFGQAHRAPSMAPDPSLWPPADFSVLVESFHATGFRPGNAWYLNDDANIAYVRTAPDGGRVRKPVLFVNGEWDAICDINRNPLFAEPMRHSCNDLTVTNIPAGHWLPLERKPELVQAIRSWLLSKGLS